MTNTRQLLFYAISIAFLTAFLITCDTTSAPDFDPINVTGLVTDAQQNPIENAIVRITNPPPEHVTTTDAAGNFSLELQVDSTITYTLEVRKEGFVTDTREFLAIPERNVDLPTVRLVTGDDDDNGEPSPPPGDDSEGSAFITLHSLTHETIQVREAGGVETTEFEFIVTDSLGTPVSHANAVDVYFEIASGPDGGESIYPETVRTQNGIAKAALTSGTAAGVVQIRASFTRNSTKVSGKQINPNFAHDENVSLIDENVRITHDTSASLSNVEVTEQSKPVSVTISGGLPSDNHFEVSSDRKNIPAVASEPTEIRALLGDRYGNTVLEGTAVYFSTNKGTIDGSGSTDADGYATSQLRTNQTSPGVATVRVETVDESSSRISREVDILFSGKPQLTVSPDDLDLDDFRSQTFSVNLADENGKPLAEGTHLSVEVNSDQLNLSGDIDVTLGDEIQAGHRITDFEFELRNISDEPIYQNVTLSVRADGPNGIVTRNLTLTAPDAPIGQPDAIQLANISENNIHVKETGRIESSTLTFQVIDEYGNPLGRDNRADIEFSFTVNPNGGERFSPQQVTTNDQGQAVTQIYSGTESGIVQVVALVSGTSIQSSPVAVTISGGYPDDNHFEVSSDKINIAARSSEPLTVSALLGDKYGNTVPEGTAVFFSTNKGTIDGSGSTDASGLATARLRTNQTSPGVATVRVETVDGNSSRISREMDILFSGNTQLTVTPDDVNLYDFTSETFSVNLADENGNPLAEGTTLDVELDHPELVLDGDIQVTLDDVTESGIGTSEFEFRLRNPSGNLITEDAVITVTAAGPNGNVARTLRFDAPEPLTADAASIYLESLTATEIGVQSTGQRESTRLTFVVEDEYGNPLTAENSVEVDFRFGASPGGGEYITDETVTTNSNGQAIATVISGTVAGVVQVIAEFTKADGTTVRSSKPVQVVIHAGLPSQDHLTIIPEQRNFALEENGHYPVTVKAGDIYGNRVPDGTAIYFSTDGGFIEGSAFTQGGEATANLTIGNPIPADGIVTITATTANDDEQSISVSTNTLFTGAPIITITPETFDIDNAEDQQFDYTVMDENGNPMESGTTITVTVEGNEIDLLGDLDITVGSPNSSFTNLNQLTNFSFIIDDADPDNINDTPVRITIEVEGPNGSARKSISGRKAKTQP